MSEPRTSQLPASVSAEDWAQTPHSVREAFLQLCERLAQLEAKIAELTDRLNVNSSNSSKPPSSDFPSSGPRVKAERSGRQRGGQKGHSGANRQMLPSDQVTRVVNHFPDQCEHCGEALPEGLMDPEPLVHQVTDIPVVLPQVTEHRRHRGHCPRCARKTLAQLPPDVPAGSFGLGVDAAVAYYTGARRCSRRDTVRTLKDLHHIDISLGAVTAIEERVSEALKPCVDQAADAIQQSKSLQRKLSQE